jgi:hypothetical protein
VQPAGGGLSGVGWGGVGPRREGIAPPLMIGAGAGTPGAALARWTRRVGNEGRGASRWLTTKTPKVLRPRRLTPATAPGIQARARQTCGRLAKAVCCEAAGQLARPTTPVRLAFGGGAQARAAAGGQPSEGQDSTPNLALPNERSDVCVQVIGQGRRTGVAKRHRHKYCRTVHSNNGEAGKKTLKRCALLRSSSSACARAGVRGRERPVAAAGAVRNRPSLALVVPPHLPGGRWGGGGVQGRARPRKVIRQEVAGEEVRGFPA